MDTTGVSKHTTRRVLGGIAAGALLAAAGLTSAGSANAEPIPPNCLLSPWGFLGLTQKRLLCDGPVFPDGSWNRQRIIFVPAHQVPLTTSCSGYSYVTCTTSGGYFQPYSEVDNETYVVTPDTVLQDEPGHLP